MSKSPINQISDDPTINIALDTINIGKQALVFCNTRRSSEATAEKIAKQIKTEKKELNELSDQILKVLSSPTKQCRRLAMCVRGGTAFHHAGLHSKQRKIIEDNFKSGVLKIICSTPTLCLSKDTLIWENMSEKSIEKINKNSLLFVLSENSIINMKPQKIEKNFNEYDLINITTVSGYSVTLTPNHKLPVKRNKNKILVTANKCNVKDKLSTIGNITLNNFSSPKFKDFVKENKLPFKNCQLNETFFYLIGAMLGDGYSGAEIKNGKIIYKGSPSLVGKDLEIINFLIDVCEKNNIHHNLTKNTYDTPQLILTKSNWFREFLVNCGIDKGIKKHISLNLMNANNQNLIELIKGLFDTDGYVEKKRLGFANNSLNLIKNLQKILLRFSIITSLKIKKPSSMKIYEKEYKTKKSYELLITNNRSILEFHKHIGFKIKRKQDSLNILIQKINSNILYFECKKCNYKLYKDLFSGRTQKQREWGLKKLKVIELLYENNKLKSKNLTKLCGFLPRHPKGNRLNHHYELISKKKFGSNEWIWSLNDVGKFVSEYILKQNKSYEHFFMEYNKCPLCNFSYEKKLKKGWRDSDFEGDIYWDKIKEIKFVPKENSKYVYDIVLSNEKKNDHLYCANGIFVHNSMGINLPAFRTIIKDLKRYGGRWGLQFIPAMEYHQMCLPYNEKIITNNGLVSIGEIIEKKLKCKVLTLNEEKGTLQFKPIKKYYKNKSNELITITTEKGLSLQLTNNHPLYVNKVWKYAKDLKINDSIAIITKTISKGEISSFFDLIKGEEVFVNNFGYLIEKVKKKFNLTDKELAKKIGINHKLVYHYKNNLKNISLNVIIKLFHLLKIKNIEKRIKQVKTRYGNYLNICEGITYELLWLVGMIATDGNLQRTIDKRTKSEYIKIRIFNNNKNIISKSKNILEKYIEGKVYVSKDKKGGFRVEIGSTIFGRVLNKYFSIPYNDKTSKISAPKCLFNAPIELVSGYLSGVFDGDGSYTTVKNNKYPKTINHRILFSTSSKEFAKDIQNILLRMGIISTISVDTKSKISIIRGKRIKFTKPNYSIYFYKKKYVNRFFNLANPIKANDKTNYKSKEKNELEHLKVKKINVNKFKKDIDVYNLEIKDNNNFFASNILVHNCGRAGRPDFNDTFGEAICIAKNTGEVEEILDKFINAPPEKIYSKLAVEPVLRTYVLSLISTGFANSRGSLLSFFEKTFYGFQYGDMDKLGYIIDKILDLLDEWDFIKQNKIEQQKEDFVSADFVSASNVKDSKIEVTKIGQRVAELYLDPYTAFQIITALRRATQISINEFSFIQMATSTLELRPLSTVRVKETDKIENLISEYSDQLIVLEPSVFEPEYDDFLKSFKTAFALLNWMDEKTEDDILEEFNITPGELHAKRNLIDWILYSTEELANLLQFRDLIKEIRKARYRIDKGVKEELIPLVRLKGIGRVRARKMFNNGVKDIGDIKKTDITKLKQLVGDKMSKNLKEQVGQKVSEVKKGKRVGQTSIGKY
jgi:replicative superfamily II helicase